MGTKDLATEDNGVVSVNPVINFSENITSYGSARYIIEVCTKLECYATTTATALHYFYNFYKHTSFETFDPFTIGCTCIYLSSKVVDDDIRLRDVINVGVHTLNKNKDPLNKDEYFKFRDSITQAELLVMRVLGFKLNIDLPHKYLLHYLRALEDWLGKKITQKIPINETAWQMLQDAYHDDLVIKYNPELIAATCAVMALEIFGVVVPHDLSSPWYSILHESCTKTAINELTFKIFSLYEKEKELVVEKDS